VQRIVRAYESAKPQQQELPLTLGDSNETPQQGRASMAAPAPQKPQ
jgi:hypothetical protein